MAMMEQTKVMERFPFPVWDWSRQMQDILHNYPHRVEDFAKSYSRNQFIAKTWMIEVLKVYADIDRATKWWVMGSWYGTLTVPLITSYFYPKNQIHLVDFDEEALAITLSGPIIKDKLFFRSVFKNKPFKILGAIEFGLTIIFSFKRCKRYLLIFLFSSSNM